MNVYALAAVVFVGLVLLIALVLVLRYLVGLRAQRGELADLRAAQSAEVAKLRKEWADGSAAIAQAQQLVDARSEKLNNELVALRNRMPASSR